MAQTGVRWWPLMSRLDEVSLKIALQHSPILCMDSREPFLPNKVGVTIFFEPAESPSFPRAITIPQGADCVVEYAIWWDWDIQHLYELEHVWVVVKEGKVVAVEGSWHGDFHQFPHWRMKETHPVLYCQPGKHAIASDPHDFPRWSTCYACTLGAGSMGLLVKDTFTEVLSLLALNIDQAIKRYLRQHAFLPSFRFTKEVQLPPSAFATWEELKAYIPERIKTVITELLESGGVKEKKNAKL